MRVCHLPLLLRAELTISTDIIDSSAKDWDKIEKESISYADRKKDEGRLGSWTGTAPTYDLVLGREIVK